MSRGEDRREAGPTAVDSNQSRETQQVRRLWLVSRRDVVESTPSLKGRTRENPGHLYAGVAVPAFDAVVPEARAGQAQRTPRRLRLVGKQPTHVDNLSGNRFSALREDDDVPDGGVRFG